MIKSALSSSFWIGEKLHEGCFREIAEYGFQAVEVLVRPGHFRGTTAEVQMVKKFLRIYQLKTASVHCDMQILDPPNLALFRTARRVILKNLDLVSELGGKFLVIHSYIFADPDDIIVDKDGGLHPGLSVFKGIGNPKSGMLDRVKDGMAFYAEEAAKRGVSVGLETETRNNEYLPQFIERADPKHCGICFDSGHAQIQKDAVQFAHLLAPRTVCMHLHDNDGIMDLHLAPFKGVIDWERLIREFVNAGYCGDFTFECRGDIRDIVEGRERIGKILKVLKKG